MWAALINSILGIGKGVIDGNTAKYGANMGRIQSAVDYERSKEAAIYQTYRSQQTTILLVLGLGVALLITFYFISKRNG